MIQEQFGPQGINIGANCGQAAGQTVFHAHIHIIPRYSGDVPNPRDNSWPRYVLTAMVPYIGALYQIVAAGQKTNSYKFALWRALARLAPVTNEAKPLISKSNLAPLHVEYYWPLEVK